jgi:tetratricopeptide (TPR) repeat protein
MAVSSNALSSMNYPDIFRTYIMRSAEYILERVQQATASLPTDDRKLALHTLSFTLKLDEAWPLTRKLLLIMAPKMEQAGYRNEWIVYLESALERCQQLGDTKAEAELRFHLGVLYHYQAKYDEARSQLENSAAHFEQLGNLHHQARALNRLAGVARLQSHLNEATHLALKALKLSEGIKGEQAYSYLMQGNIAFNQRDWQKASHFFGKSLALWKETNDERMIAWSLTNLGGALWALTKYDDAIDCYEKAINLFERIQDPVHLAVARMNLGNVYLKLDYFDRSIDSYLKAEQTFRKTTNYLYLAMVNNNKGMTYQNLRQWQKAKQAYLFSISQWQQIGNISEIVNVYDNLGLVYHEQALYDKAIATFQKALDVLKEIKDHPSYNHLLTLVTKHLHAVQAQKVS